MAEVHSFTVAVNQPAVDIHCNANSGQQQQPATSLQMIKHTHKHVWVMLEAAHNFVHRLDLLAYLFPCWCKRLAVTTPGSIELYEHIVARENNFIKSFGRDDLHGARVVFGRLLRLDSLLELSRLQICMSSAIMVLQLLVLFLTCIAPVVEKLKQGGIQKRGNHHIHVHILSQNMGQPSYSQCCTAAVTVCHMTCAHPVRQGAVPSANPVDCS